jgi:hypothetical protein
MIVDEFDVINYEAGADNELRGKECQSCARLLTYKFFPKKANYKDGYGPQCYKCLEAPRLSIKEHTSRLQEMNYNSEGTRRQRHVDTDLMQDERPGKPMDCSLFLQKLLHIYPQLYVTQGMIAVDGVVVDLALYATSGGPRADWSGNSFKYLGYITLGIRPEYSRYEFDQRDVMLRCIDIGWRSVLIRFIENRLLTEEQCEKEFGPPSGGVNSLWYKKLHQFRNSKII